MSRRATRRKNTFGPRLRQLRESREWSQADLAIEAGISRPLVTQLEAGKVLPGWETVVKLARALGESVAVFEG